MIDLHISTQMTGVDDLSDVEICPTCGQETYYSGWHGKVCSTCGRNTGFSMGKEAQAMREKMGFSRKELGEILGFAPVTIRNYEFAYCSKNYYNKFMGFAKKHWREKNERD